MEFGHGHGGRCFLDRGGDNGYVGFGSGPAGLTVHLPYVFASRLDVINSSRSDFFRVCGLVARLLRRYAADQLAAPAQKDGEGATGGPGQVIGTPDLAAGVAAAAELLADYLREGPVGRRKIVRDAKSNSGVPDWARTLRLKVAELDDNVPIYYGPITRRRTRSKDDELVRLHSTVVIDAAAMFGVRLDVPDETLLSAAEYRAVSKRISPYLRELGARLFRDREKHVLRLIEQFFFLRSDLARTGNSAWTPLFGIREFEFVWEAMLRQLLGNEAGYVRSRLPAGTWYVQGGKGARQGIRPRVDFARAVDKVKDGDAPSYFCLFDAKYMGQPEWEGRWAGEGDVYKQVIYWYLARPDGFDRTINALVFPEIGSETGSVLRIRGLHYWSELPGTEVFEVAGDFERLSEAYILGRFDSEREVRGLLDSSIQFLAA